MSLQFPAENIWLRPDVPPNLNLKQCVKPNPPGCTCDSQCVVCVLVHSLSLFLLSSVFIVCSVFLRGLEDSWISSSLIHVSNRPTELFSSLYIHVKFS